MIHPHPFGAPAVPTLDEDGLLRHGGRWVAISISQLPVVALLLGRMGRLVANVEIMAAYQQVGGSVSEASFRSLVHRLRRQVGRLGLELRSVRGRGFVLDLAPPPAIG